MHFIDIHTHIIPEVDDGSKNMEETIAMLSVAYEEGAREIVATPHMFLDLFDNFDFLKMRDRFSQLISDLESRQDRFGFLKEFEVYLGAENYVCPEFLEALEQGRVLTLNGSRYLLIEVSPTLPFTQIQNAIQKVFLSGYTPVLAHIERCVAIQQDPLRAVDLWEMGCVTQVNSGSLLGKSRSQARKCADRLLREGLVDVIASDTHRPLWRPPNLGQVLQNFRSKYATEDLKEWLSDNPSSIVSNHILEAGF